MLAIEEEAKNDDRQHRHVRCTRQALEAKAPRVSHPRRLTKLLLNVPTVTPSNSLDWYFTHDIFLF